MILESFGDGFEKDHERVLTVFQLKDIINSAGENIEPFYPFLLKAVLGNKFEFFVFWDRSCHTGYQTD